MFCEWQQSDAIDAVGRDSDDMVEMLFILHTFILYTAEHAFNVCKERYRIGKLYGFGTT